MEYKICTVPIKEVEKCCKDPRLFYACVTALEICKNDLDRMVILDNYNKICELLKCPYLKTVKK